jgi:hypothetical protein
MANQCARSHWAIGLRADGGRDLLVSRLPQAPLTAGKSGGGAHTNKMEDCCNA